MKSMIRNNIGDLALPIAMVVLCAIFTVAEPAFLSLDNLNGILRQVALTGIMAIFMTFVIMTGGIDLSIGPVMALAGLAAYAVYYGTELPVGFALVFGLVAGAAVGAINGFAIAVLRLPPIIMTLGMLSIVRGFALLMGGPDLHQIRDEPVYTFLGNGRVLGLPVSVWVFLVLTAVMLWVQKRTSFGLMVSAIGDNARAVHLSGRSVAKTVCLVYIFCGVGAAIAGMLLSSQVHTASATYGEFGTELDVIAAVVLGGASLMGGKGSVLRTFFGVLLLGVINNGLNIMNVPVDQQLMVKGVIIVAALALSEWAQRAKT